MDRTTKRALWILAGGLLLLALILHHNISSDEVVLFCVIVPSIILHEVSHGWVARAFGDDTAARAGRLSLNPFVHVDPVGTLIVPALLALAGHGVIGWAKPVPVNTMRLRHPRNEGVIVALAGPVMNALLAALGAFLFIAFFRTTVIQNDGVLSLPAEIFFFFSLGNIGLMVFNLVPLPPLDGSALFERLLPARYWPTYLRIRPYTMMIVVGLVILNFLLNPGPITVAFDHLYNWWAGVLYNSH